MLDWPQKKKLICRVLPLRNSLYFKCHIGIFFQHKYVSKKKKNNKMCSKVSQSMTPCWKSPSCFLNASCWVLEPRKKFCSSNIINSLHFGIHSKGNEAINTLGALQRGACWHCHLPPLCVLHLLDNRVVNMAGICQEFAANLHRLRLNVYLLSQSERVKCFHFVLNVPYDVTWSSWL